MKLFAMKENIPESPNRNMRFDTLEKAMAMFIQRHCVPATIEWDPHEPSYIHSEIRIVLNSNGSGYIHLIGQDSETIEFKQIL